MKKLMTLQRRHVGDYSSTDSRKSLSGVTSLAQRLVLFLAVLLMGSNGAWADTYHTCVANLSDTNYEVYGFNTKGEFGLVEGVSVTGTSSISKVVYTLPSTDQNFLDPNTYNRAAKVTNGFYYTIKVTNCTRVDVLCKAVSAPRPILLQVYDQNEELVGSASCDNKDEESVISVSGLSATANYSVKISNQEDYAGYFWQVRFTAGSAPTTYTVNYSGNGNTSGSVPTDLNSPYSSGASVTVLGNTGNLAKTGCTFGGWQIDRAGNVYNAGDNFTITANRTLYAKWNENTPAFTAQPAASTNVTAGSISGTLTATATDAASYAWYQNTTQSTDGATQVGSAQTLNIPTTLTEGTYYFYCVATNATLTAQSNYATVIVAAAPSGVITSNKTWDFTAAPFPTTSTSYTSNQEIDGFHIYAAESKVVTINNELQLGGSGSISGSTPNNRVVGGFTVSAPCTIKINAKGGSGRNLNVGTANSSGNFEGKETTSSYAYYTYVIEGTGNKTIYIWSGNSGINLKSVEVIFGTPHAVTKGSHTNGDFTVSSTSALEGTTITLNATPNSGYEFSAWDVYKTGEPSTKVTVTSNKFTMPDYDVTVDATFALAVTYAITKGAHTNGDFTISPSGAQTAGTQITLSATPASGYQLASWDVYKTGEASTKVTVTDNKFIMPAYAVTVEANFEELTGYYTLTYEMNGHGTQIPAIKDNALTFYNMHNLGVVDGYYFDGWFDDQACTQLTYRGTLTANKTIYAKWVKFTGYTYTEVPLGASDIENGENLKNAINNASSNASIRKVIYLPNGTYDFGTVLGPKIAKHNISIIGESQDGVIIKNAITTGNSSTCATITVNSGIKNVYFENLTIENAIGNKGIAAAVYDGGSNTIYKNVTLKSYQDTYTSYSGDKNRYFKNCEIWGLTDFICGEGKILFDECKLVVRSSDGTEGHGMSYMTANSANTEWLDNGYIFNNCTVESHVNEIYFGRMWNNNPMVSFINTKFTGTGHIASARWYNVTMGNTVLPEKVAEYNSTKIGGTITNVETPASNKVTFKTDNNSASKTLETVIDATEAATYTMTNIYPYWIANNYYTITKDEPANGTVNVYPTYVAAGDKVKAFATPAAGYVKDAWNVYRTGNEASKVAVDANDMFVMPAYNTTVSANFVDDGTVGTADCETAYADDFSQPISIAAGKTRHITFNNKSKGVDNWNNFYLIAMGSSTPSVADGQNYMRLRADWYEDINPSSTVRLMKPTAGVLDEADWKNDMKDADVDMYVSYSGSRFYVNATITAKGGSGRSYTYTAESPVINEAANPAYLFLSIQKAYLSNIKVDDETDAFAVSAIEGTNGTVSNMTNSIGMNVTSGTCVQTGEKINFTATPDDGYKFSNWTTNEGATVVTTANPYEATIAGPTTLTANFVTNATQVVAAPVIDASYPSEVTITAEGGAKIYYTLDGTNNPANGKEYTGPFALTESTPIRAVASTDNAQTFSAETIANVNVNTDANVKLLGSASLSSATLKPYEWNITEGANAVTYSLSCDDSGRKRALWSLFDTDDAYKVSANYQYHLTTPLGFKVTKIAIIGRSNSSSNDANITLDGQNLGKLMQSSPEVIKTLTYEVTNPEYGKEFTIQSDREMLINIELWGTMSTVFTAEATSAQPAMGAASVSEAVVASGSNVTFYAQPEDGYAFVNWTNASGEEVSRLAEYTVSASANLSLTANFRVAGSEDATLTSLSYNGINIPLVEDQYVYNVRALSTVMPNVVAVANDANATINYTQATDYNGTATIEVVAETGNVETYTVNFTESNSVPTKAITWRLNGGSKTRFVGEVTNAGTVADEQDLYGLFFCGSGDDSKDWYGNYFMLANATSTMDARYIKFTGISGSGKFTITTGNPSASSPATAFTVSETKDGTALASGSLTINSNNESSAYTYKNNKTYYININGKMNITSITWTPYEIQDGKDVTLAVVNGGRATISGDKITYVVPYGGQNASTTIPVTLTLSNRASATATSPFPTEITSGTEFNVELGVASGTKVNSTVTVYAENGETQTYSVQILRGSQATSAVLFVETDGQDEYLTKEHIGNAKYATISYDGTGTNSYDGHEGTYYDIKNSKKSIEIVENGAMFYNVYVQHNNSKDTRKLDLYVDGVKVKTITVAPRVLNESGILPINADGTNDGENHTITLKGAGSDVYPVKIKFYTTKQAASLTPAAVAIKMGKVTEDIAVKASSGAVVSFDETASAAANEYVTVSYSNGSLSLTPKKAGETTLYFDIAAAGAFNAKDNAAMTVTISKQDLTLTYSPSSYECNLDDEESTRPAWVTPTLVAKDEDGKTVTGLTYTYFSDDESIATVASDGTITRHESSAVGSAGIYATFAGDGTYNDAQAVFTVKYVQGFTYQITDKTKFAGDKTNPAVREQIVLKDKEDKPLVYATFGGWKRNSNTYHRPGATADRTDKWAKPVRYTGTQGNKPLYVDGFEFATSGADNACEETMEKTLPSTHEDYEKSGGYFVAPDAGVKYPFTLPVRGAYMTFEPTQNGQLTVYILQNGAFNSKVDADGNSVVIPGEFRKHSFYVADQDGNIYYEGYDYGNLTYVSKQNVSNYYDNTYPQNGTEWKLSSDEKEIQTSAGVKVYDADVNSKDVAKWPEYYKNYTVNERKNISVNWADEETGHGMRQMVTVLDDHSHFLAMKAYAKYSMYVLAGQTYYIFSNRSKLGFCGMNFVPDTEDSHQPTAELTLADNVAYVAPTLGASDNTSAGNNTVAQHGVVSVPQYKTVTLNRTFSAGNWETICLPFTMTEKEVEDNFGVGTELIIMNSAYVEGTTLKLGFVYHEIQSILAGYPYLIKPTNTISAVTVSNKIIDKEAPQMTFSGTDYVFKGIPGYSTANVSNSKGVGGYSLKTKEGDVFLSGNKLYISQGTSVVKGYRAYIDFTGGLSKAKNVALSFGNIWDVEDKTTALEGVMADEILEALGVKAPKGVYNLNGQKVAESTIGLPAGVYIINGNKTVIK